MTRDSVIWWFVMAGALLGFLMTNFELLHQAFPGMTEQHEAWIRLACSTVGVIAGVLRMSPLPISDSGRSQAIQKNAEQATVASVAATVAAVKADEAVKATSEASKAADVAVVASVNAAEVP